ncbi:hypothetical protein H6F67_04255 [Microcoleus sp. FACHB-1515]|uniref:hypothetical protein n=1 Tax=Cyanophyceae TaxID=3028117 RepID=UPI00168810DE|nr:hypothetical protein [Microcoleus sp. FACHB-1515]MBD2089067.1 hypothetical protein [Microcoleus sp. FACHB-1515]
MKIAILGWGSLIWKPGDLPIASAWKTGGPVLPLEFSRVSDNRKLTLVLDPEVGASCATQFAFSDRSNLADAIEDLATREQTVQEHIGFVDLPRHLSSIQAYPHQVDVDAIVRQWCDDYQIEAAIWTALKPNFQQKLGVPFSSEAAINYLKQLPPSDRISAIDYFRQTPAEIHTPLRQMVTQLSDELDSATDA